MPWETVQEYAPHEAQPFRAASLSRVKALHYILSDSLLAIIKVSAQGFHMDETTHVMEERERNQNRLQAITIRNYPYGKEIVREGDNPPCFFVVLSGQIRLSRRGKAVLSLGDQDIFALEHLMLKRPCFYTATAMTESRIAAYGPEALDHLIRNSPRMTQNIMTSVSRQLVQLSRGATKAIDSFSLEDVEVRFFRDAEVIIKEGTVGKEFYRLVSTQGGLRVSIRDKELSSITTPGEFFGEMSGLLNMPRQATVTSVGESVVEKYNVDNLDVIIEEHPEIAHQMIRTLTSRLMEMNLRLTEKDI